MLQTIIPGKNNGLIKHEKEQDFYIKTMMPSLQNNSYYPGTHKNKKILTIMACHANNELRYKTAMNNLNYIKFINNDIIIVNSINEFYSAKLKENTANAVKAFIEIPNDSCLDIGKWCRGLREYNYNDYDFVVFINDSFIIKNSICHFYNKMIQSDVELYGYNDSSQISHHYQSYLFGVRKDAVMKLVTHFLVKKPILKSYRDVVANIELKLTRIFQTKDCFLKIAHITSHEGKSIYANNPKFYDKLFKSGLLPFIKLKQLV